MRRPRTTLAVLAGTTALLAATAQAADAKTVHLFSKNIPSVGGLYGPDGTLLPGNAQPAVGSYFIGADNDFLGTHAKHAKRATAWDHIVCTVLDPATFTVRCDAMIAFPTGVIFADQQTVKFSAPTQKFTITAGTGAYRKAKGGSLTARNVGTSDNADLVLRY